MNIASLMVDTMLYNSDSQEDREITLCVLDDANKKHQSIEEMNSTACGFSMGLVRCPVSITVGFQNPVLSTSLMECAIFQLQAEGTAMSGRSRLKYKHIPTTLLKTAASVGRPQVGLRHQTGSAVHARRQNGPRKLQPPCELVCQEPP